MLLEVNERSYVVFDLDDTLYPEIDFVRSGFQHVSRLLEPTLGRSVAEVMMQRYREKQEVLGWLSETFDLPAEFAFERLLHEYRHHHPELTLPDETCRLLDTLAALGVPLGLLTDGRSVSQRNKLAALGLEGRFTDVIISEEFGRAKPDPANFRVFEQRHPGREFAIIADNTAKDFEVPSRLGWLTICVRSSPDSVHAQNLDLEPRPRHVVDSLAGITVRHVGV